MRDGGRAVNCDECGGEALLVPANVSSIAENATKRASSKHDTSNDQRSRNVAVDYFSNFEAPAGITHTHTLTHTDATNAKNR